MDGEIIELFSPEYLDRKRKRNRRFAWMLLLLALLGLGFCVGLCIGVNTENTYRRMLWTIGVSALTGWIVIYFYVFGYRAAKREIVHGEHLQDAERETLEGEVEVSKLAYRIRGSVNVRKVTVKTWNGSRTVNICASRGRELAAAGKRLRLWLAHGYVTAYEVRHENT